MKIAYFDSVAGVSGDMFVGALLDAGASYEVVREAVAGLNLPDVETTAEKVKSHGLQATAFRVFQKSSGIPADHACGEAHRSPLEMIRLIGDSPLDAKVKAHAISIIDALAVAEASVHGVPKEKVHFHEVGGVDTIVDAVAASAAFVALGLGGATASPVCVGGGRVATMHGTMPVPAPATLELLRGAPVVHGGVDMEVTTPTGSALLRHFASSFGPFPDMVVLGAGYGAGTRDIGSPNVFRVVVGTK